MQLSGISSKSNDLDLPTAFPALLLRVSQQVLALNEKTWAIFLSVDKWLVISSSQTILTMLDFECPGSKF